MVDTHAHISTSMYSYFLKDLKQELLELDRITNITGIINVGLNDTTNREVLAISGNFDTFYCSLGIHPLHEGEVDSILKLYQYSNNQDKVVALGETGIDLSGDVELNKQIRKFIETIELANFLKLPIIIHANKANKLVLDILHKHPAQYGFVFHFFEPDMNAAEEIIRKDGFISVGKNITWKNAQKSLEVVKNIPIDNLLIETDYPFMASDIRADIKTVFNKVSELRNIEKDELDYVLENNAKRLFYKLK